jgi:hypothetical protein
MEFLRLVEQAARGGPSDKMLQRTDAEGKSDARKQKAEIRDQRAEISLGPVTTKANP